MRDGIVCIQRKDLPATRETTLEVFAAVADLTEGVPSPLFFDTRGSSLINPSAWEAVVSRIASTFSAVALVIDPNPERQVTSFLDIINRLLIPVRGFTDEAEAVEFLRGAAPHSGV